MSLELEAEPKSASARADVEARMRVAQGQSVLLAARQNAPVGAGASDLIDGAARLGADILGLGPLAELLADIRVSDVLVNGSQRIWVDRGQGLELTSLRLQPNQDRELAVRMAAACGKRLDEAAPIVDGTLPDGTRLHAVIPPLSRGKTVISLRTCRSQAFTLDELIQCGTVDPEVGALLEKLVQKRCSILISGATGSGKTTLLTTLLGLVPANQRIVCIEEVSELQPDHPHFVSLQERRPNVQGRGGVTMSELVRAAMRMRPDRLVLGECRGAEVREVLAALNTGHDGGMATIHANSTADIPARLQALGALAGMSELAVTMQAAAAVEVVIQIEKQGLQRRVTELACLNREGGALVCEPVWQNAHRASGWQVLQRRLGGSDRGNK